MVTQPRSHFFNYLKAYGFKKLKYFHFNFSEGVSIYILTFVAKKYDQVINKRLSSIKCITLGWNFVGEVEQNYEFQEQKEWCNIF